MLSAKFTALLIASFLVALVNATPLEDGDLNSHQTHLATRPRLHVGWKALRRGVTFDPHRINPEGQLGSIFYIADNTDFTHNYGGIGGTICEITVDENAWRNSTKHWVTPEEINANPKTQLDALYPGEVIFAYLCGTMTAPMSWQMGPRAAELEVLQLQGECFSMDHPRVAIGQTLEYDRLTADWGIAGQAERPDYDPMCYMKYPHKG